MSTIVAPSSVAELASNGSRPPAAAYPLVTELARLADRTTTLRAALTGRARSRPVGRFTSTEGVRRRSSLRKPG